MSVTQLGADGRPITRERLRKALVRAGLHVPRGGFPTGKQKKRRKELLLHAYAERDKAYMERLYELGKKKGFSDPRHERWIRCRMGVPHIKGHHDVFCPGGAECDPDASEADRLAICAKRAEQFNRMVYGGPQ